MRVKIRPGSSRSRRAEGSRASGMLISACAGRAIAGALKEGDTAVHQDTLSLPVGLWFRVVGHLEAHPGSQSQHPEPTLLPSSGASLEVTHDRSLEVSVNACLSCRRGREMESLF